MAMHGIMRNACDINKRTMAPVNHGDNDGVPFIMVYPVPHHVALCAVLFLFLSSSQIYIPNLSIYFLPKRYWYLPDFMNENEI